MRQISSNHQFEETETTDWDCYKESIFVQLNQWLPHPEVREIIWRVFKKPRCQGVHAGDSRHIGVGWGVWETVLSCILDSSDNCDNEWFGTHWFSGLDQTSGS